jgi:hypothetical protein
VTQPDLTAAGIWRLMWLHRAEILKSWDFWTALIVAGAATLLHPEPDTVVAFASIAVGVTSAIIGIVLAALAIVTAFLDRTYVSVLNDAGHGMATEVFGFRYPAAVAVLTVIVSGAIVMTQDETWYCEALRWILPVAVFLFLYTLFITLNLVAAIGGHMMNRAAQLDARENQDRDGPAGGRT